MSSKLEEHLLLAGATIALGDGRQLVPRAGGWILVWRRDVTMPGWHYTERGWRLRVAPVPPAIIWLSLSQPLKIKPPAASGLHVLHADGAGGCEK